MSKIKFDINKILKSNYLNKGEKNISSNLPSEMNFKDLLGNNLKLVQQELQKSILLPETTQKDILYSELPQKIDLLSKPLEKTTLESASADKKTLTLETTDRNSLLKNKIELEKDNNVVSTNVDNITNAVNAINTDDIEASININDSSNANENIENSTKLNADNILPISSGTKEAIVSDKLSSKENKTANDKPISLKNIYKDLEDILINKSDSTGQMIPKGDTSVDLTDKLSNTTNIKEEKIEKLTNLQSQIDNLIKNISAKLKLIRNQELSEGYQLTDRSDKSLIEKLQLNENLDMPLAERSQLTESPKISLNDNETNNELNIKSNEEPSEYDNKILDKNLQSINTYKLDSNQVKKLNTISSENITAKNNDSVIQDVNIKDNDTIKELINLKDEVNKGIQLLSKEPELKEEVQLSQENNLLKQLIQRNDSVQEGTKLPQKSRLMEQLLHNNTPAQQVLQENVLLPQASHEDILVSKAWHEIDLLSKPLEKTTLEPESEDEKTLTLETTDKNSLLENKIQLEKDNNAVSTNVDNITNAVNAVNTDDIEASININDSNSANYSTENSTKLNADKILPISSETKEAIVSDKLSPKENETLNDKPISLENIYKDLADILIDKSDNTGQIIAKEDAAVDLTDKLSNVTNSKDEKIEKLTDLELQIDNLIKNLSDKLKLIGNQELSEGYQLIDRSDKSLIEKLKLNENLDMPLAERSQLTESPKISLNDNETNNELNIKSNEESSEYNNKIFDKNLQSINKYKLDSNQVKKLNTISSENITAKNNDSVIQAVNAKDNDTIKELINLKDEVNKGIQLLSKEPELKEEVQLSQENSLLKQLIQRNDSVQQELQENTSLPEIAYKNILFSKLPQRTTSVAGSVEVSGSSVKNAEVEKDNKGINTNDDNITNAANNVNNADIETSNNNGKEKKIKKLINLELQIDNLIKNLTDKLQATTGKQESVGNLYMILNEKQQLNENLDVPLAERLQSTESPKISLKDNEPNTELNINGNKKSSNYINKVFDKNPQSINTYGLDSRQVKKLNTISSENVSLPPALQEDTSVSKSWQKMDLLSKVLEKNNKLINTNANKITNATNADNILPISSKTKGAIVSDKLSSKENETLNDKPISLENIYKDLVYILLNKSDSNKQIITKEDGAVNFTDKLSNTTNSKDEKIEKLTDLELQIDNLIKNLSDKSQITTEKQQSAGNLDMPLTEKPQLLSKEPAVKEEVQLSQKNGLLGQLIQKNTPVQQELQENTSLLETAQKDTLSSKLLQEIDLLSKPLEKTTSALMTDKNDLSENNVQLIKDSKSADDDRTKIGITNNTVGIANLLNNFFSAETKLKDEVKKASKNEIQPISQINNKVNSVADVLNNEKQSLNKDNFTNQKSDLLNELNLLINDNTANSEDLVKLQYDFKDTSYKNLGRSKEQDNESVIENLLKPNKQNISNEVDTQENLINKIKHEIKEILESSMEGNVSNIKEELSVKNNIYNNNLNNNFSTNVQVNNGNLLENILVENKDLSKDKNVEIFNKNSENKIFNKSEGNYVKEKVVNDKSDILTSVNKNNSEFKNIKNSSGFNTENNFLKRLMEDNKDTKLDKVSTLMNQFIVQNQNNNQEIANVPKVVNKSNFTTDIIKSIRYMENKNIKDMTVKIKPKELGELYIKITYSADGIMKASVSTNNRETFNLLNANIQDLNNNLNNSQIKVQHIDINIYNSDTTFFSNSFNQNQSNENNSQHKTYSVSNINNEEGDTLPEHIVYEDNKLNILV